MYCRNPAYSIGFIKYFCMYSKQTTVITIVIRLENHLENAEESTSEVQ